MHPVIFSSKLSERFRGYMPVVVDVETGGFDFQRDALLEIAAVPIVFQADANAGKPACRGASVSRASSAPEIVRLLRPVQAISTHVTPFPGANIDPRSLEITGIDVDNPLRGALDEREALELIFKPIRALLKTHGCKRAILVGHNAHFDLNFINQAIKRTGNKRSPFHPFSVFDTVSLAGMCLGQTVLAKALWAAGIEWNQAEAHSALYDAEKTAELFCYLLNRLPEITPSDVAVPSGSAPPDASQGASDDEFEAAEATESADAADFVD